jgi:hypothetical protein
MLPEGADDQEWKMHQMRGFLPWIVYPVAAAVLDWRIAAVMAALVAAGALAAGRGSPDGNVFGGAAVAFFASLAVVALVWPDSGLHRYVGALTPAALAIAAAVSILRRQPFTIPFAKRMAPAEYWDTPLFLHINTVLSAVWATSFAAMAAIIAAVLAFHPQATGIILVAQIAGFVIPMRICRQYPASVRDRLAAA